jgi:hypothetical protein
MNEPIEVDLETAKFMWPFGYCDNGGGHIGEHPLYTSSDGGCKNFVTSERLLEIKQLFDLAEENESLKTENLQWRNTYDRMRINLKEERAEVDELRTELEATQHLLTISEEVNQGYEKDCAMGFALQRDSLKKIIREARQELEMISPVSSKVRPIFEYVQNALDILGKE